MYIIDPTWMGDDEDDSGTVHSTVSEGCANQDAGIKVQQIPDEVVVPTCTEATPTSVNVEAEAQERMCCQPKCDEMEVDTLDEIFGTKEDECDDMEVDALVGIENKEGRSPDSTSGEELHQRIDIKISTNPNKGSVRKQETEFVDIEDDKVEQQFQEGLSGEVDPPLSNKDVSVTEKAIKPSKFPPENEVVQIPVAANNPHQDEVAAQSFDELGSTVMKLEQGLEERTNSRIVREEIDGGEISKKGEVGAADAFQVEPQLRQPNKTSTNPGESENGKSGQETGLFESKDNGVGREAAQRFSEELDLSVSNNGADVEDLTSNTNSYTDSVDDKDNENLEDMETKPPHTLEPCVVPNKDPLVEDLFQQVSDLLPKLVNPTVNDITGCRKELKNLADQISTTLNHVPLRNAEDINRTLKLAQDIANPDLETGKISELQALVSNLMREIRPLDFNKLAHLLHSNRQNASSVDGQDIVLLIGTSGSGKTTTFLFLAGTKFEEQELDECDHYEPIAFPSEEFKEFKTSPGSKSVTRTIQTAAVKLPSGESVVLCDTPGFGDSAGPEVEISNSFGLLRAIQSARTVRPILVLSREGMGDRFQGLRETLATVSRMTGGRCGAKDLDAFGYVFTKCGPKDYKRLSKQLAKFRCDLEDKKEAAAPLLLSLVDDLIKKTSPLATVVRPDGNDAEELLKQLASGSHRVESPRNLFQPFLPEGVSDQLNLQLQWNEHAISCALETRSIGHVVSRVEQLRALASVLPCAVDAVERIAAKVKANVVECRRLLVALASAEPDNDIETFRKKVAAIKDRLEDLADMEHLAVMFDTNEAGESERMCVDKLCEGATRVFLSQDPHGVTLNGITMDSKITPLVFRRLSSIHSILSNFPFVHRIVDAFYGRCCTVFTIIAGRVVEAAGKCLFQPVDLHRFVAFVQYLSYFSPERLELCPALGKGEWEYADERRMQLIEQFEIMIKRSHEGLLGASACFQDLKKQCSPVTSVSISNLNEQQCRRTLLRATVDASDSLLSCGIRFDDDLKLTVASFDGALFTFVRDTVALAEEKLQCIQRNASEDLSGSKAQISDLLDSLTHANSIYAIVQKWPQEVATTVDQDWKHFLNVRAQAELLSKSLDDRASSMVKQLGSANNSSLQFLNRLRRGQETAEKLLFEVANNWDNWTHINETTKKHLLDRLLRWAGFSATPSKQNQLTDNMREIASFFNHAISNAVRKLNDALRGGASLVCDATVLLQQMSAEFCLFLQVLNIRGSPLWKSIFNCQSAHLLPAQLGVLVHAVTRSLESLIDGPAVLAGELRVKELIQLLRIWKTSPSFPMIRSFVSNPTICDEDITQLREYASKLPAYADICRLSTDFLSDLVTVFERLSFCDAEGKLNAYSRSIFFRRIASQFSAALDAVSLEEHVGHDSIRNALGTSKEKLISELDSLDRRLHRLLDSFPQHPIEFSKIESALLNLKAFKTSFRRIDPNLVAKAGAIALGATQTFNSRCLTYVEAAGVDVASVARQAILMKKASRELSFWRSEINSSIDEILSKAACHSQNPEDFVLGLVFELKSARGEDAALGLQVLSEHKCLEGAANAIFNSATAQQDISYVLNNLQLSHSHEAFFVGLYEEFELKYRSLVYNSFPSAKNHAAAQERLEELVSATRSIAKDHSIGYSTQVSMMLAHMFAHWSLSKSNAFVTSGGTVETGSKYLMKPHAAQVVAVWLMVNSCSSEYQILENHLVEVKTGEGKSIILAMTAIILALFDCEVECVCYSKFLSSRDYSAFCPIFRAFRVTDLIRYGTIQDLGVKIGYENGTSARVQSAIREHRAVTSSRQPSPTMKTRPQVLLVDEIDVFFQNEFYGNSCPLLANISESETLALFQFIWSERASLSIHDLLRSEEVARCLNSVSKDMHKLMRHLYRQMLHDANAVSKGDNWTYTVLKGNIAYKYLDGHETNHIYRFETAFAHLKEYELGNITHEVMTKGVKAYAKFGHVSYAEVPLLYDVIMGVTGTLKALKEDEKKVLQDTYRVDRFSFLPSVYGSNKLTFAGDTERDVILCDSTNDHHLELRNEIDRRRQPTVDSLSNVARCVLVFFDSKESMMDFYNSSVMESLQEKTGVITEILSRSEKETAFLRATEQGSVTLMLREYGRGTDFKYYDSRMLRAGGAHVIQAFFSTVLSEEIQIKGRCARQGSEGSYSMVLNCESLRETLNVTSDDIRKMRSKRELYSFLSDRRQKMYSDKLLVDKGVVVNAENNHYRTIAMERALAVGLDRKSIVSFLEEMNGIAQKKSPFGCQGLKEKYLLTRRQRIFKHAENDRAARAKTKQLLVEFQHESNEKEAVFHDADSSHYEVLEVSQNAEENEILSSFRRLAKSYHPDKCPGKANSGFIFQRLMNAREALLCPSSRRAYDAKLAQRNQ